jgi:hypothetical protein
MKVRQAPLAPIATHFMGARSSSRERGVLTSESVALATNSDVGLPSPIAMGEGLGVRELSGSL